LAGPRMWAAGAASLARIVAQEKQSDPGPVQGVTLQSDFGQGPHLVLEDGKMARSSVPRKAVVSVAFLVGVVLVSFGGYVLYSLYGPPSAPELEWDTSESGPGISLLQDSPNDSGMLVLRERYKLDQLVRGANSDLERLRRIVDWVHGQWKHSGSNVPTRRDPLTILGEARAGKQFRCVEYAVVTAACARALGMPARVLALKRKDVETAESGAGHVVAEVWLRDRQKWVFADAQFAVIPALAGLPLNAVEFQEAIARHKKPLSLGPGWSGRKKRFYLRWVAPYLYYFDFALDQRFFLDRNQKQPGRIMLVPKGASRPHVFQRRFPIRDCTYVSNPQVFYPKMVQP